MPSVYVSGVEAGSLGYVSDLSWSSMFAEGPSGCFEASFTIAAGPRHQIRELARGSDVQLRQAGWTYWRGQVISAERTEGGIQVTAYGAARFGNDFGSVVGSSSSTTIATAIASAISRGWRITAGPYPAWAQVRLVNSDTPALNTVQTLLTDGVALNGLRWTVWEDLQLRFEAEPTAVRWVTRPSVGSLGLLDDDYYTHIAVLYATGSGQAVVWRGNDALAARYGRREKLVNLVGLGATTEAIAGSWAASRLALTLPRIGWGEALDVDLADLRSVEDVPAHPTQVRAGQRIRLDGVMEDHGAIAAAVSTVVTLGEVKYAAGSPTITLSPAGLPARDLASIVADITETPSLV